MAQYQEGSYESHATNEVRTLWMGDLAPWMDENYLHGLFQWTGEVSHVKVIRSKQSGQPEGYGFVEFNTNACAEKVLQTCNGTQIPGTEQLYRLNWASFGIGERRPEGAGSSPEFSVFVGDLSHDVTDLLLQTTFSQHYSSVKSAKVVTDPQTGRSKGYGFVRFSVEADRDRAMAELNGQFLNGRAMRISSATPRKSQAAGGAAGSGYPSQGQGYGYPAQRQNYGGYQQPYGGGGYAAAGTPGSEEDPNNTTIFVGGLSPTVTEEELRAAFSGQGEPAYVKIPTGKGCGFVQYSYRPQAEEALARMQGAILGGQAIRLSWGRSPANKQRAQYPAPPMAHGGPPMYYDHAAYAHDPYGYQQHMPHAAHPGAVPPQPQMQAHPPQGAQGAAVAEQKLDPLAPVDVPA
eukprot:jgi/Mesvir1/2277/Mv19318-RA.1